MPGEPPSLEQALPALARAYAVQLIPPDGDVEAPQLFADLGPDKKGRPRRLELMFLPREDADELVALQFFVLLPFGPEPAHVADLGRFLSAVNVKLPLGHFGMAEEQGWVYFRSVSLCPLGPLDPGVTLQTARVCAFVVGELSGLIESVADGTSTLESARRAYSAITGVDDVAA